MALATAIGLPSTHADPTDPVTPVDQLNVDQATQTGSVSAPGESATLTTNLRAATLNPTVDIVFVIDTTGTMASRLPRVVDGVSQFVKNLTTAGGDNLAFGIYTFGDLMEPRDVQKWALPLTTTSSGLTAEDVSFKLAHQLWWNDGGGDTPEDAIWAGFTVAATTPWRPGAQREVVVVGDIGSWERLDKAYYINGQAPTLANWKAYSDANNINTHFVNASGTANNDSVITDIGSPSKPFRNVETIQNTFGSDHFAPIDPQGYTDLLTKAVVVRNGSAATFRITPKLTVTYADGTPSTDLVATATPSAATTVDGTAAVGFQLTARAVAAKDIARPGQTTTAYLELVEQGTNSVVARQTITFTAPDPKTVRIIFVDDDNRGETVAPVAGFKDTYTGMPGQPVGFTETLARSGIPSGYVFAALNNVVNFGPTDETITVHLRHAADDGTVTTTRTIHYTGAASNPPDVPQILTWDTVKDVVTNITTYTARATEYPAVASPVIPGYTTDKLTVAALPVTSPTTTAPASSEVTVTYSPNLQVVNVVFVDDGASGAVVTPAAGFESRLTGSSGTPVGFTQADAEKGIPSGYRFVSLDNVPAYDDDDTAAQTITVHLIHDMDNGTVTTNRMIKFTGAGEFTPPDVSQPVTWNTVTDRVTGVTTYTAVQTSYPALTAPVIAGYTADPLSVPVLAVTSPTTTRPESVNVTVTYRPNTQVVHVVFVDDDAAGAVVAPAAGFRARLTGDSGTPVGFTQAMAEDGIPAGYTYRSMDNVLAYDFDDAADQTIRVHLSHGVDNGDLTTTRTIHYTGAGSRTPPDLRQTVTWTTVTDAVTGATTYTAASAGYLAATSPGVAGYTADTPVVPALKVASPATTLPTSVDVTVTYAPNTQVVNVIFVDDETLGTPVTPAAGFQARLTGASGSAVGFTQAMAQAGIPAAYQFASLDNVSLYDFADDADQTITVHLTHKLDVTAMTTTRTIRYEGAGAATPAAVSQTVGWVVTKDLPTSVVTYTTDSAGYAAVATPVIAGYTPDVARVEALAVVPRTQTMPQSVQVKVTYAVNQQRVHVKFVDDDASGKEVTPVIGFVTPLVGSGGTAVGFTQAAAASGAPDGYVVASVDNVATYDLDDRTDQTITVHLTHKMITDKLTVTRTIHYAGAGADTPKDEVQPVEWTVTTDAVTMKTVYTTTDKGYGEVAVPALTGYTVDLKSVAALAVGPKTETKPVSTTVLVTYTKIVVQTGGSVSDPGGPGPWALLATLLMGFGMVSAGWALKRRTSKSS